MKIEPFIFTKEDIKVAIYGIGHQKDDKLNIYLDQEMIDFTDVPDATIKILMIHQNRPIGDMNLPTKECFNFSLLAKYDFDILVWGHEHEPIHTL
jgi:predicted phosphodiesterase